MIPVLQPADCHSNKVFKTSMKQRWVSWLHAGVLEYTKTGKRKRASYNMVAQWVDESWKELSEELIRKTFLDCSLSPNSKVPEDVHSNLKATIEHDSHEVDDDSTVTPN
jgi:hypothetical protein